jgi:hypothetical protein
MRANTLSSFHAQARDLVARNKRRAEKIIGTCYMLGDGLVAVIPAVKSGFLSSLMNMQPAWSLLERAYVERPLPVAISGALVLSGVAIHRGRFALANIFVTGAAVAFMADLFRSGEYWSLGPMVPNLAGGIVGMFHKPLARRFHDSKSSFLRNILGQPESAAGKLFSIASAYIVGTSIVDADYTLLTSAVAWTGGNTLMALLPPEGADGGSSRPKKSVTKAKVAPSGSPARAPGG